MKVASLASLACCVAVASAQYFSEGWKPGQKAVPTTTAEPSPEFTPGVVPEGQQARGSAAPGGFVGSLLQGPVAAVLAKAGINLTASLAAAEAAAALDAWDDRVPLIHDDNYDELVVNEPLTPEEEKDRLWFVVISTAAGQQQQGGISKIVDKEFDSAYNQTLLANDLPHVKWARIDYINVTYLTTKWNIWRGPFLLVIQDRGQSLRFFQATRSRLSAEIIRNFLKNEGWRAIPVWDSAFAPGGNREFILHYYGIALRKVHDFISPIPKFILMIASGGAASLLMGLLHRSPKKKEEKPAEEKQPAAVEEKPAATPSTPSTPSSAKKSSGKSKKGGKK